MPTYEYEILQTDSESLHSMHAAMNEYGAEGFRVVSITSYKDSTPSFSSSVPRTILIAVMEREKED